MMPAARYFRAFFALAAGIVVQHAAAQQSILAPVSTVNDAVFRSQWVGPQVDRPELLGLVPTDEGIKPVEDMASKVREGFWLGSLRIRPGLGSGWAYSSRNVEGQTTGGSSDQSLFLAPTLGLEYGRARGPWSISARAGGGYVHYFNPNYSPNGTGGSQNPINGTMSLGIGHSGQRHAFNMGGAASYGNGQSPQAGGASTQLNASAGADYSYLVNDFVTTGAYLAYNIQTTRYDTGNNEGSNLTSTRGGGYIDWLWTGKTTLGVKAEAGRMTQDIIQTTVVPAVTVADNAVATDAGAAATEVTLPAPVVTAATVQDGGEGVAARQFVQILGTAAHNLTSKVLLVGGLGASFTQDENIPGSKPEYTGLRPVYLLGVKYDLSEKTSMRLYSVLDGFDIVPGYGFGLTWRPRQTTAFTLSIYQNQGFSISTVDQFQVNRGFTAGVQQTVFSRWAVGVSGGWQQTENVSISEYAQPSNNYEYAFVSASIRYSINSWASWQATLMGSTGNRESVSTTSLSFPETTANVALNLLF